MLNNMKYISIYWSFTYTGIKLNKKKNTIYTT